MRSHLSDAVHSPQANFEHTLEGIREGVQHEQHRAGEALGSLGDRARNAISPTSSGSSSEQPHHQHRRHGTSGPASRPSTAGDEEDEGWMSDQEGEPLEAAATAGSSATPDGRRHSRSPKSKLPKPSILRPGAGRRRSIRRGMFGARVLRRHDGHETDDSGHEPTAVPPLTATMASSSGDADAETESEHDISQHRHRRGRRATLSPISQTPVSSSPVRARHARIDSLRSVDTSRRSLRESSPARSIRWADYQGDAEGLSVHRRSGTSTPRFLSPSTPITPLPGSEDEGEDERPHHVHGGSGNGHDPTGSPHMVRFEVPELPPRDSS